MKVSKRGGWWSMFVGIDADVKIKTPVAAAPILTQLANQQDNDS